MYLMVIDVSLLQSVLSNSTTQVYMSKAVLMMSSVGLFSRVMHAILSLACMAGMNQVFVDASAIFGLFWRIHQYRLVPIPIS